MKDTSKLKQNSFTQGLWPAVLIAVPLLAAAPAFADDRHDHDEGPPGSLAKWQELYWRWAYGGITLPTDPNGNAVEHGVVLMPIPNTPGDGTPGHLDVTLSADQSWVMPLWGLIGTSYADGTPPDAFLDTSYFKTLDISFQIDGKTIVSHKNVMDYFSKTKFDPPVPYNSPPLAALIWLEDIGVAEPPLRVGTHTMKLDVKNTIALPPNFGGGFGEFHNTWTVTVLPEDLGNHNVAPPDSRPYGKTYGEWAAKWWQWALAIPTDHNPLYDETGADAAQGQSGPVWFLCGVFNASGTAERTVTLPAEKALLFPIVNNVFISTLPTDPTTADGIRPMIAPLINDATDLACEVDGVAVQYLSHYCTESPLFEVTLPADNVFGADLGTYGPSMDEGYYLMLDPLKAGNHLLHFHGSLPDAGFSLDITYHLTVQPDHGCGK